MTALSIQPTFPTFTGADGQPLENGYIWVGTANLNPITNPITVYWDAALSAPATQPIRTLGGYPSNSGTPARLYVNSDYSIQVLDRKGSVVYSAPVATDRYGGGIINANIVVYDPSGTGAVATTVQAKLREQVSVKDFGAVGDGVTDDTAAIQAALDYVASLGNDGGTVEFRRSGSTVWFPNGTYKTTAPLVLLPGVYHLSGAGRFKAYPQVFVAKVDCLPTIMPVHSGRNCFTVAPGSSEVSFKMHGINIATLETGLMPTAAIGFDCTGSEFQRDFTLDYVGIFGFTSPIDVYGASGVQSIGVLKVHNCSISRNTNLIRCLDTTYINLFQFTHNEAGQNTNGMVIRGSNIEIVGNSLESIENAVTVSGTFLGGEISNNYFEANTGSYVISLHSTSGVYIGQNSYNLITATERIRLTYDVNTVVEESEVLPFCDGSWNVKTRNNTFAPTQIGAGPAQGMTVALNYDGSQKLDNLPIGVTEFGAFTQAETTYTTSGTGIISHTKGGISIAVGSWIGVSFLVTYQDEPAITPIFYLRPNTTDTDGQVIGNFYEFNNTPIGLKGRTFLFFGVTKVLNNTLTSMQSFIYPFGINPAAGLVCKYSGPLYYNFGTTLPANAVQAFALHRQVPQESGTWTPTYVPATGSFTTLTMDNYATCRWTRVGRVVFINALFRTDEVVLGAASGQVSISELPFTVGDNMPCTVGRSEVFVNAPVLAQFAVGTKTISLFKRATATGSSAALAVGDLTVGASGNANDIQICGWYLTSE